MNSTQNTAFFTPQKGWRLSPFGVLLDERSKNGGEYRYGFQNQEMDDEIKGKGNSINYKYRMHDSRVGRFFAVDPLTAKYSYNSAYAFSENRLLDGVEFEGLEFVKGDADKTLESLNELIANPVKINQAGSGTCVIAAVTYLWLKNESRARIKQVAHKLFFSGTSQIHNFKLEPSKYLQKQDPNGGSSFIKSTAFRSGRRRTSDFEKAYGRELDADWLLISSIQNSMNKQRKNGRKFLGHGSGTYSETGNAMGDAEYLMKNLLGYTNVLLTTHNSGTMNPVDVLNDLVSKQQAGYETIMFVSSKMLQPNSNPTSPELPNHAVTFIGNVVVNGNNVSFDVQSWGDTQHLVMSIEKFKNTFSTALTGKKQ